MMGSYRDHAAFRWEDALEEGLPRILRLPKGRKARIAFIFGFIRRIREIASYITDRDLQVAEEVLKSLNFTQAARELSPDNPDSMRARISSRYAHFQALCEYSVSLADESASSGLKAPRSHSRRLRSRTVLRGPEAYSEPVEPEFACHSGYTPPTHEGTTKHRSLASGAPVVSQAIGRR
jgi:hypothetical protein